MPPKEMDSEPDLTPEQVLSEVDTKMDRDARCLQTGLEPVGGPGGPPRR